MNNTLESHEREPGIAGLLRDLRDESTSLIRQEIELAKVETNEKLADLGGNLGFLAAGGAVAYLGAMLVLMALSSGLAIAMGADSIDDHPVWIAPLIVGSVVAIVGYALVIKAIVTLKSESLIPEKTQQTLKENAQWAKNQVTPKK